MAAARMTRALHLAGFCLTVLSAGNLHASSVTTAKVSCGGEGYRYLVTAGDPKGPPAPAVLLLHGAGGRPDEMVDAWKKFAAREHIVLIAPELPRKLEFEAKAPQVFRCVVEDARRFASVDPQRIFVFGYSMGGYLAFDAAMFDSEYFAAVAVYGMTINPDYDGIVKEAKRKTPIMLLIGERDPTLTLAQARRTRDLLVKNGFPLEYKELKGRDHNYWADADEINSSVCKFFDANPLPAAKSPQP